MSNDTTYRLQFRHPNKARLEAVRTFVTVVKPALCQFVQNMKFDPEWSAEKCLNLLGIRNLSEVITWFRMGENLSDEPDASRVTKDRNSYVFTISAWANENSSNVGVSGPDGELDDLLQRFPGLEISGRYEDEYGAGSVSGFDKEYEMEVLEYRILDPSNWDDEECAGYSMATKRLLMTAHCGAPSLEELQSLIDQGADVNAKWKDSPFLSILLPTFDVLATPEHIVRAVELILEAGWRFDPGDSFIRGDLVCLADKLRGLGLAHSVRLKIAETLLERSPRKDEDADRLFRSSVKAREERGALAATFLGVDPRKAATKLSKKDREWLRWQKFPVEP